MTPDDPVSVVRAFLGLVRDAAYDRLPDRLDPEVVWFGTRGGLDESQVVRGPEAVVGYLREIEEPWESLVFDVERLIPVGDAVVAFILETGRARGGVEVQNRTAMIFRTRGSRIVETTGYLDRDEALRAAEAAED